MSDQVRTKADVVVVTEPWIKPLPNIDDDNREFWDGLKDHRLLLWTCSRCGARYFPKAYCQHHENEPFAGQMSWQEASSVAGVIQTANIHRWAFDVEFKEDVPYAFGLVRLDDGPLMSSSIDGVEDAVACIGQRVTLYFEDHPTEGFTLPRFKVVE